PFTMAPVLCRIPPPRLYSAAARPSRRIVLFASDGRVPGHDGSHGVAGAGERRAHESGDQVASGRRNEGFRAVSPRELPPHRGHIGGQIGEAGVARAAHDQHLTAGHPVKKPVPHLQVAHLLLTITLEPEEWHTQVPAARERLREGAVEVPADQEPGSLRNYPP